MSDRPFSADQRILIAFFKAVEESKRGCSLSQVTPKGQSAASFTRLHQAEMKVPPELNSRLSFEKLVGIIRGFSWKCDNGNLDWIVVEISEPFGRQMSRKTSGDPVEVKNITFGVLWK